MKSLLVFVSVVLMVSSMDVVERCQLQNFGLAEKEVRIATHFDQMMKSGADIHYDCLEFLMLRGFYRTAVEVYEMHFILNQIDVSKELHKRALVDKEKSLYNVRELQHIFKHAITKTNKVQTVQPVFHWAQSRNHTLINLKFSHRVDSPACLSTKIEDIKIEANRVYLRAFGIVSHLPIKYEATIDLFKDIDPATSFYKQEAVGTIFFNLTKTQPDDLWIRLTSQDVKIPIWWDMKDQLQQDMEDFVSLLEEQSEKRENKQEKKYRKIQKKRQDEKDRQERIDKAEKERQTEYERNQCSVVPKRCENGWYMRQ